MPLKIAQEIPQTPSAILTSPPDPETPLHLPGPWRVNEALDYRVAARAVAARSTPRWYASLVVRTVALVAVVVLLLGALVVAFITRRDRDDARETADRLQSLSEFELRGLASTLVANHQDIAKALPLRPLADGLQAAFDPRYSGTAILWRDLIPLAIWTVIGSVLAVRYMRSQSRKA